MPFIIPILNSGIHNENTGWTIDNTQSIKGWMSICILYNHGMGGYYLIDGIHKYPYNNEILNTLRQGLQDTGFLFVSCFFMLGFYGCRMSLKKQKREYMSDFLLRRFQKVYLPFILINLNYS